MRAFILGLALVGLVAGCTSAPQRLRLATTTSTADSGLLEVLIPSFDKKYNAKVEVIAVGTGQAIALGERGDADVVLAHARNLEDKFITDGHGTVRFDVMYNDFVITGPPHDPAQIKGLNDATEALRRIAQSGSPFLSRGDGSGTHVKEKELWQDAKVNPAGAWYLSLGQGMGETITTASEKQGYLLADRGTLLSYRGKTNLVILVEGDPRLRNPYGVIPVSPTRHPGVNAELAAKFAAYLTSMETQQIIASFGVDRYGQPLFFPDSLQWREAHP